MPISASLAACASQIRKAVPYKLLLVVPLFVLFFWFISVVGTHIYAAVDDSYSKSLLHFDGTDASTTFTDESGKSWTANGNAQIDTAQYKFGGASGLFDGNGDYISTTSSSDFSFTGDFTIDTWVKYSARQDSGGSPSYYTGIITDAKYNSGSPNGWRLRKNYVGSNNDTVDFSAWTSGSNNVSLTSSTDIGDGSWHHIAVVRHGTRIDLYVDGTSEANTSYAGTVANDSNGLQIGKGWNDLNQDYHPGWIEEARISNGIARWTSNFTPPNADYQPTPTPTPTATPTPAPTDGWTDANATWTYGGTNEITLSSSTMFSLGDKIRLKQGGGYKYFYVSCVCGSGILVTGGSDYSLANAAITDNYYSKASTPVLFPQYFNWTPTYTGSGSLTFTSTTTHLAKFSITGRSVHVTLDVEGTTGGTASSEIRVSTPVTPANSYANGSANGAAVIDPGTGTWEIGKVRPGSNVLIFTQVNNNNFATGNVAHFQTSYTYEF